MTGVEGDAGVKGGSVDGGRSWEGVEVGTELLLLAFPGGKKNKSIQMHAYKIAILQHLEFVLLVCTNWSTLVTSAPEKGHRQKE
jgi:hypothetical protein